MVKVNTDAFLGSVLCIAACANTQFIKQRARDQPAMEWFAAA